MTDLAIQRHQKQNHRQPSHASSRALHQSALFLEYTILLMISSKWIVGRSSPLWGQTVKIRISNYVFKWPFAPKKDWIHPQFTGNWSLAKWCILNSLLRCFCQLWLGNLVLVIPHLLETTCLLTWPAAILVYKRKILHKSRVQFTEDWYGQRSFVLLPQHGRRDVRCTHTIDHCLMHWLCCHALQIAAFNLSGNQEDLIMLLGHFNY